MLEPVIQNFEPRRFLLRTFFPGISTFNTEKVDLDFVRGGRTMAPFVGKGYGSKRLSATVLKQNVTATARCT